MIVTQFKHPHVMYQTPDDDEMHISEPAIAACVDASGLIILQQGNDTLLVNRASVPELCKLLRTLARKGEGEE